MASTRKQRSRMIIPLNVRLHSYPTLPPQLARIGNEEVVLIELQGSLIVDATSERERDGRVVGKLHVDENKAMLRIGYHLLEGKVASLSKPLAVLHRVEEGRGWDVVAVVKRKIVFSNRPTPIVGDATALGQRKV